MTWSVIERPRDELIPVLPAGATPPETALVIRSSRFRGPRLQTLAKLRQSEPEVTHVGINMDNLWFVYN